MFCLLELLGLHWASGLEWEAGRFDFFGRG
jgi:hypothetical protein